MIEKLQLAYNSEGVIVSIYNVPTGKDCGCYFIDENKNKVFLVAKNKGKNPDGTLNAREKSAHFARLDGVATISYARESMIHSLAKELLLSERSMTLPPLRVLYYTFFQEQKIVFEKVEVEKDVKTEGYHFIPDAVGYIRNKEIFIEFYKTHRVDEEKYEKVKKHGIACVEFDLSDLDPLDKNGNPNILGLKERLVDSDYANWIYNQKENELMPAALKRLEDEKKAEQLEREERLRKIEEQYKYKDEYVNRELRIHQQLSDRIAIAISNGYKALTVYQRKYVYCPKEKSAIKDGKIYSYKCERCEYFLEQIDDKYLWTKDVLCGFKSKITDHKI